MNINFCTVTSYERQTWSLWIVTTIPCFEFRLWQLCLVETNLIEIRTELISILSHCHFEHCIWHMNVKYLSSALKCWHKWCCEFWCGHKWCHMVFWYDCEFWCGHKWCHMVFWYDYAIELCFIVFVSKRVLTFVNLSVKTNYLFSLNTFGHLLKIHTHVFWLVFLKYL